MFRLIAYEDDFLSLPEGYKMGESQQFQGCDSSDMNGHPEL